MLRRNIKFHISYDGTRYLGWQRLGGKQRELSIQGFLEICLSELLNENIKIMCSGRTDAGVHAYCQVANFYTNSKLSIEEITKALIVRLPEDLVISNMEQVTEHSTVDIVLLVKCMSTTLIMESEKRYLLEDMPIM